MSKKQADEPQPLWRGHPLYVAPDGRFSTLDKERFDQYMAAQEREQALKARMDARRSATAETASEGSKTTDQGVTTDATADTDEDEQPAHKSNRRRRSDDDGR